MNHEMMSNSHESSNLSPWRWGLPAKAAVRLPAAPQARWLRVSEGRVWLTSSTQTSQPSADIWLEYGERLQLPARSEWVLEGWPQAQVELFQAPPAAPAGRWLSAWWGRWWRAAAAWLRRPHACEPA